MTPEKKDIQDFLEKVKKHPAYEKNEKVREIVGTYGWALLKPDKSEEDVRRMMTEMKQALGKVLNEETDSMPVVRERVEQLLEKMKDQYEERKKEWLELGYEKEIPSWWEIESSIKALPPQTVKTLLQLAKPVLVLSSEKGKRDLLRQMSECTGFQENLFFRPDIDKVEFYAPDHPVTRLSIVEGEDDVHWLLSPFYKKIMDKINADFFALDADSRSTPSVVANIFYRACESFGVEIADAQQYLMLSFISYEGGKPLDPQKITFLGGLDEMGNCLVGTSGGKIDTARVIEDFDRMVLRPSIRIA